MLLDALQAEDGVMGLRRHAAADALLDRRTLALLALRPFVTGAPTVVVWADIAGSVDEPATPLGRLVAAERITSWG
jgi:hypothetical protein